MPVIKDDQRGNLSRKGVAAAAAAQAHHGAKVTDFQQRRLKAFRHVATEVNAGRMSPTQGHAALQHAGFIPGGASAKKPSGVGGAIAKTVAAAVELPVKIAGHVVKDFTPQPYATDEEKQLLAAGHLPEGWTMLHGTDGHAVLAKRAHVEAGFVAPGTGLVSQVLTGLARDATYNPGGVEQAIVHPGRTARKVGHNLAELATHPQDHPDQALLAGWAAVSGGGSALARAGGAASAIKKGEGIAAAVKRPGYQGGSLLHSPEPGTDRIYVPGGKPAGGIGPVNAEPIDRLLSRNPVAATVQRARNRRIQRKLNDGAPAGEPRRAIGRFIRDNFSAQATVGREIRAKRRVETALAQAPVIQQQRAVHGRLGVGDVSRGENAALQVIATEGADAFTNPAAAVERHIVTHQRFIREGHDTAENHGYIADLKLAQHALEHPSKKFLRVVEDTRSLSHRSEAELIARGHLKPDVARGRRTKIAKLYGREHLAEDGFFFPLSRRYTEAAAGDGGAASYTAQPRTPGGIGPVQESRYDGGLRNEFTGKSVHEGQRPPHIASAIGARATRLNRLHDAEDFYGRLWKVGSEVRTSEHQIPIRATKQIQSDLRKFFAKLADDLHATPEETVALNVKEMEQLIEHLEAAEHKSAAVGVKLPGVRWVDNRYIKNLGENGLRGPFEKFVDSINNPARALQLYARPAYALNLAGNGTMQAITQGHLAPKMMQRAATSMRTYGRENTAKIDSLVGASKSRSYAVRGKGELAKFNEQIAEAWNAVTDLWSRRSAFYHEAAKAGFNTPAEIHALLSDSSHRVKLIEVARRANKNMIDYGSLTPLEQSALRRAIYFYPFMSRAAVWTLRTLVEHPGKAFTLAQLALIGEEHAHDKLGAEPAWADHLGLIPIGKPHDGVQGVANPQSINTPSALADLGRATIGTAKNLVGIPTKDSLGDLATPAATVLETGTGRDPGGRPPGFAGLLQALPQIQAIRRLGIKNHAVQKLVGAPSKSYPETGYGPAIGPYAGGGAYVRGVSVDELNKQAEKEQRGQMSPPERATHDGVKLAETLTTEAKTHWPEVLVNGQIPPEWRDAVWLRTQRLTNLKKLGIKAGDPHYEQKAYIADIKLLGSLGKLDPAEVADGIRWARLADEDRLRIQRLRLGHGLFRGSVLSYAKKQLKERGAD